MSILAVLGLRISIGLTGALMGKSGCRRVG
jgi:hypothetical protein